MSSTKSKLTNRGRTLRTRNGDWRPVWLAAYRKTGMISRACEFTGVARQTVYDRRKSDELFARAWDEIESRTIDQLEKAGIDRALDSSDRMVEFFLKAHKPEKYRDNMKIEHTGPGGGPQQIVVVEADHERASGVASILAEMGAAEAPTASSNGHSNGKAG